MIVVLTVYALLLFAGGMMGFKKAGSKASLIAGSISGVLSAMAAGLASFVDPLIGFGLGLIVSISLAAFFNIRWVRSKKFMPAGLMTVVSYLVVVLLLLLLIG